MSRTVASYVGSQLFEAVGISETVLGALLPRIQFTTRRHHARAHRAQCSVAARERLQSRRSGERVELRNNGEYQWRRDGEIHLFNPRTVQKLQHATRAKRFDIFKEYTTLVDDQSERPRDAAWTSWVSYPVQIPLPIDEVESTASIIERFSTGAMSYGSISEEAHSTLAIAMNRMGAKSNTGEGGEDEERFDTSNPRGRTAGRRSSRSPRVDSV